MQSLLCDASDQLNRDRAGRTVSLSLGPSPAFENTLMRLTAFLTALLTALLAHAEGFQGWYQNTLWLRLNERWSVGNYSDLRVNDAISEVHTWMISPRVSFDLDKTWQLQLNTTFVEAYNADETLRPDWFRIEFEANPTVPLNESFIFRMRNRFEWRWRDGDADYGFRIRVRPQIDWVLRKEGLFRGFYANNEVFYDFDADRFTENRLIPFGVILRPHPSVDLRVYYLWRHTRGLTEWRDYDVLGAIATISF